MKDVMIDLETLGTRYNAQIIQIGACFFDRNTGEIGDVFSANVMIDPSEDGKFTTDYDTIKWWFEQSQEARESVMRDPVPLSGVLGGLNQFVRQSGPDVMLWSHATFDIPILMNAFNVYGIKFAVPFRNMRDLRTLMDLSYADRDFPKRERTGIHHNALDDAQFQASYAADAFVKLNHGKENN